MHIEDARAAVRIEDFGPMLAIQRGYLEGAAELLGGDSPLRGNISELMREFDTLVSHFPEGSRERLYLLEIRMIASGLAQGMTHRSRVRTDRLNAARQEREVCMKRVVQTQTMAGILRGGVQLLLVGGFAYAVVGAMFSLPRFNARENGLNENFVSLAIATGSALVGSFLKAWWLGFRVHEITQRYDHDVSQINAEYAESMRKEYQLAAQEANLAWKRLTGREPTVTSAFQDLLLEVMSGENRALCVTDGQVPLRNIGQIAGAWYALRSRVFGSVRRAEQVAKGK